MYGVENFVVSCFENCIQLEYFFHIDICYVNNKEKERI